MLGRLLWLVTLLAVAVCILDPTYFDALKVSPSAELEEIREAYRKRKEQVSEEGGEKAQKKLSLVEEGSCLHYVAFRVLSNQNERLKYERYGREAMKHITKFNREK